MTDNIVKFPKYNKRIPFTNERLDKAKELAIESQINHADSLAEDITDDVLVKLDNMGFDIFENINNYEADCSLIYQSIFSLLLKTMGEGHVLQDFAEEIISSDFNEEDDIPSEEKIELEIIKE